MSKYSSRRSDQHYHHYNYPSFSSSLLEEIYRSFDEDSERDLSSHRSDTTNNSTTSTYKKLRSSSNNKSSNFSNGFVEREKSDEKFRVNRFVLDQWMKENNNNNQKINNRRNSMPNTTVNSVAKLNSSSSTSSSDSSSGICGFSSSDTDSLYGSTKSKSKSKPTLKPIKTTVNAPEFHRKSEIPTHNNSRKNNNNERSKEGNLQKRALKLYGDLKKVKQPISPGGKLATFLNSLFNSNASKKAKISSSSTTTSSSSSSSNAVKYSMTMSTPSTASSYSRSCLSKTPSSAGRFERRSVRFCPVNTVMAYNDDERKGEDEEEEDHLRTKASKNDELKVQIMEKHRRVEEVAKELLKNYQYHNGRKFLSEGNHNNTKKNNNIISSFEDEDEDEDEDDASCCSSDLFELDNLLEIGGNHQRYCEELPVYETTHVHTNRAIAKGFIL